MGDEMQGTVEFPVGLANFRISISGGKVDPPVYTLTIDRRETVDGEFVTICNVVVSGVTMNSLVVNRSLVEGVRDWFRTFFEEQATSIS